MGVGRVGPRGRLNHANSRGGSRGLARSRGGNFGSRAGLAWGSSLLFRKSIKRLQAIIKFQLTVTVAETAVLLVTVVVLVEVSQGVEVGVELVSHGVVDSCSRSQ